MAGAMGTARSVETVRCRALRRTRCPVACARKVIIDATGIQHRRPRRGAKTEFLSASGVRAPKRGQAPHRLGAAPQFRLRLCGRFERVDLLLFGLRHAPAPNAWDLAQMPDSRTPPIVPDYAVNAQDVTARRPFPDVVVQCRSRQDSHGYLTDDFRFLSEPSADLVEMKRETSLNAVFDVNVPLRSLLPKGVSGIAVVGIATGCARDVLPMVRMQADLMNMGYAVGTAAAMAVRQGGEFRKHRHCPRCAKTGGLEKFSGRKHSRGKRMST